MEEIKEMLQELVTTKTFLKGAINEKGGTITDDTPFSEYPNQVRTKTGNVFDTLQITENGEHNVKDYKNVSVLVESEADIALRELIEGTNNTLYVPYGTTQVGQGSLYRSVGNPLNGEVSLNHIYLPNTVKKIGSGAFVHGAYIYYNDTFEEWLKLDKRDFVGGGSGAKTLLLYVNNDEALKDKDLIIPNTLSELKNCAVQSIALSVDGKNYYDIHIPNTISSIGEKCFQYCYGIKDIIFEEGTNIETLPENALSNIDSTSKGKIVFPITKKLSDNCCRDNKFSNYILKEGLEEIGKYCFYSNSYLEEIYFPKTLKIIGMNAFYNCTKLKEIVIPEDVTEIATSAFGVTTSLKSIIIEATVPFTISSNSFNKQTNLKIYVPKGTSATFKSATNWSSYASYIYERYVVVMNVPSQLLNNEAITYSIDGGKTYQQFTNSVLSLDEVATIKIKSTDSSQTIKIGTTEGGNDVGTISNSELTFSFTTDTQVYLTIQ